MLCRSTYPYSSKLVSSFFVSNTFRYAFPAIFLRWAMSIKMIFATKTFRHFVILQFSCMTNIITDQHAHIHTHMYAVENDVQARVFCETRLEWKYRWTSVLCAHVFRFSDVKPNFPIALTECHCGCESKVHYEYILLEHNWELSAGAHRTRVVLGQCHLSGWRVECLFFSQRWSSIFPSGSDYMGYNRCEWAEVKRSWRRIQTLPFSESAWAKFVSIFLLIFNCLTWKCHDIFTLMQEKHRKKEIDFPMNENNAFMKKERQVIRKQYNEMEMLFVNIAIAVTMTEECLCFRIWST